MNPNAAVLDEAGQATAHHPPVDKIARLPLLSFHTRKAIPTPRTHRRHEPIARRATPHEKDEP